MVLPSRASVWHFTRFAAVPCMIVAMAGVLGFSFHTLSRNATDIQLRERLLNTVSVAALTIDPADVRAVSLQGEESSSYTSMVHMLKKIRVLSPHVRFVYIMRRTDDPAALAFVADADALSTTQELDVNGNGIVDIDEEAARPGDLYPIEDAETLQGAAFSGPVVDPNVTIDQWGRLVSAYAPIVDQYGVPVGILGIDINESEFNRITQGAFSIFIVTLVVLAGVIVAAYLVVMMRQRRYETLAQLDADRIAMLDLATHQLGAPLATFRWWLEILKEQNNGAFCKTDDDVCQQLEGGIERLSSVIEALNRAGSIQRAQYRYTPKAVSLSALVRRVVRSTAPLYARRGQQAVVRLPRSLPYVNVDPTLFEGVVSELLENASWYSPDGAQVIVRGEVQRGKVLLIVEDHGCGIASEDLPHVGEQLRRGSEASTYKPVGNGLGLYIARRIVERAGGKLRIDSVHHQGTIVTITLPSVA